MKHCKSYYYSNACRVVDGSTEDVKIYNESKQAQNDSQDNFIDDSKTDSMYIESVKELTKYHPNSRSAAGGGAAESNSGGVESNSMVIGAAKSNSGSAAGGGAAESISMTIDQSNEELNPPLMLFQDMNKLMDTGLSENDKNEINELIQIFDPTFVRTEITTRKRDLIYEEDDNYGESSIIKSQKNKGGRKSKKHRRKNLKKQSRKNKKYTR